MKTTTDIASFLKRLYEKNDGVSTWIKMYYSDVGSVFVVSTSDGEHRSKYLDDALENLAEATRRRANDMQPMRDAKPELTSAPLSQLQQAAAQIAKHSMSGYLRAPSTAQSTQQYPTCPKCGLLPYGGASWILPGIGLLPGAVQLDCKKCGPWTVQSVGVKFKMLDPSDPVQEVDANGHWKRAIAP